MKLRFLLDKTAEAQPLASLRATIHANLILNPDIYTFNVAADSLATIISSKNKGSGSSSGRALGSVTFADDVDRSEIMRDGKIYTGHYDNPKLLHPANWALVRKEREKYNKSNKTGGNGSNSKKSWKTKFSKQKKEIKAMKATIAKLSRAGDDNHDDDDEPESGDNAGNAFGGRSEKRNNKKQRT